MNTKPLEVGERIAAILKLNVMNKKCYFLGYGVYEGKDIVPENTSGKRSKKFIRFHIPCCKLCMDDGNIYYDFQCWFMSEERFKEVFIKDCYKEGWKVVEVDLKGRRKDAPV
jgi:predicted PolB exonuclease-like 3'-5' exonuclease